MKQGCLKIDWLSTFYLLVTTQYCSVYHCLINNFLICWCVDIFPGFQMLKGSVIRGSNAWSIDMAKRKLIYGWWRLLFFFLSIKMKAASFPRKCWISWMIIRPRLPEKCHIHCFYWFLLSACPRFRPLAWFHPPFYVLQILDDTFASQMQQLLGNALQEKDIEPPKTIVEVQSMLCRDAPSHKGSTYYYWILFVHVRVIIWFSTTKVRRTRHTNFVWRICNLWTI